MKSSITGQSKHSNHYPLDLIQGDLIALAVVEIRRPAVSGE